MENWFGGKQRSVGSIRKAIQIHSKWFSCYKTKRKVKFFTFCTKVEKKDGKMKNCILLPKLFWLTVRENCSSDWEKLLKFEAEGQEFANFLRSLEQFIQTVKGQNNFW